MAGGWLLASQFAAGGLLLLLAAALLVVKFNSRVNRAFALYLLLEGLVILFLNVARLRGETDPNDLWLRLTGYAAIVLPLALAWFLVAYRTPRAGRGATVAGLALLLLAATAAIAHAADPCAFTCIDADGEAEAGPLVFLFALKFVLQALIALLLAGDVARGRAGVRHRAVFLVAVAFGVLAYFESGLQVLLVALEPLSSGYAPGLWIAAARLAAFPAFALALLAVGVLARTAHTRRTGRRHVMLLSGALAATTATILYVGLAPALDAANWGTLLSGFWRILMPAVVTYALVRHRLFDIDLKVRASLVVALVAGIYGGTYFLVSEGLEGLVSNRFGTLAGLAAAGLLTLLARPITGWARRLAKYVVPGVSHLDSAEDRESIYQSQYLLLMEDGTLTPKERRVLDQLMRQLGISQAKARSLEAKLARAVAPNRTRPI
jgi:hypothetical protein